MNLSTLEKAIAGICATERRYAPQAYYFLHEGLLKTLAEVEEKEKTVRHISGAELADGLRRHALESFGPLAKTVLNRWGVHATRDFGEMVFALLDAGLIGKTDEDHLDDFNDLYDFDQALLGPFRPRPKRAPAKPRATRKA